MVRPSFLSALLLLAGAVVLPAQDPAAPAGEGEAFPAEVEQVIVDLVVTDEEGDPIAGLTADDLVVSEDGVRQEIVSFEAVRLPDEPAQEPPPRPRISTNTGAAAQRGRVFVIVFDDLNLSPHRARDAKAAVASFLTNGVREGDHVTLIASGGEAWWTTRMEAGREELIDVVKRLEGRRLPDNTRERMTDWEAMRIHVYHDELVIGHVLRRFEQYGVDRLTSADSGNLMAGTTVDPVVSTRASQVYYQARARNRVTLEVLERALDGLASVRGRKSVILVSEGFINDPNLEEFRRVNVASRRANAAIYFVNAQGLDGMPVEFSAQFGPPIQARDIGFAFSTNDMIDDGSEVLAEDSGGFVVKNTNDLDSGIERIARESRTYYLLGYVSSNSARDGRFREIEVEPADREKDWEIRARRGYYAPSPGGESDLTGAERAIQAALDSPWAEDDLPLRATHYVGAEQMLGQAEVVLVAELDVRALDFAEEGDRRVSEIDVHLVVAHRESGEHHRYDQDIALNLKPETYERLTRVWFPIQRDFALKPGDHQARIIVRERGTGRVGSLTHAFEVPPLEGFRTSTPVISDTPWKDPETGILEPQPLARREFPQGTRIACRFEVYGAERDESGMPRVAQGSELLSADGAVVKRLPESVIEPTSLGALVRLFTLSLDDTAPGEYEVVMTVRDRLSGETLRVEEPITVVPPPSADAGRGSPPP